MLQAVEYEESLWKEGEEMGIEHFGEQIEEKRISGPERYDNGDMMAERFLEKKDGLIEFGKWKTDDSDRESVELPHIEDNEASMDSSMLTSMMSELKETIAFAPSMEVQAEKIKDIYDSTPELQFAEWKKLGIEDRTKLLGHFEERIASVERRPAKPVLHEQTKPRLMGYNDGQKLVISDRLVGSNEYKDYKETLNTLFHEGRHSYQNYNLYVNRTEKSDEIYKSWIANREKLGYSSSNTSFPFSMSNAFREKNYYKYYTQPVEVDARLFAETVENKLGLKAK